MSGRKSGPGDCVGEFTPRPTPRRDENSPVIDMNFNLMNQVIRSQNERIAALTKALAAISNTSSSGLIVARRGMIQPFSISANLTIPADWYSIMVDPIIEPGVTVDIGAGGLWYILP